MERLGDRIARHRSGLGLTQAELALRVGISRVALSNLEARRAVAGERTVILLAATFGMEPPELVAGTDYPPQKAERLPERTARFTTVGLWGRLIERDAEWLPTAPDHVRREVLGRTLTELSGLRARIHDPHDRRRIDGLLAEVRARLDEVGRNAGRDQAPRAR